MLRALDHAPEVLSEEKRAEEVPRPGARVLGERSGEPPRDHGHEREQREREPAPARRRRVARALAGEVERDHADADVQPRDRSLRERREPRAEPADEPRAPTLGARPVLDRRALDGGEAERREHGVELHSAADVEHHRRAEREEDRPPCLELAPVPAREPRREPRGRERREQRRKAERELVPPEAPPERAREPVHERRLREVDVAVQVHDEQVAVPRLARDLGVAGLVRRPEADRRGEQDDRGERVPAAEERSARGRRRGADAPFRGPARLVRGRVHARDAPNARKPLMSSASCHT